MLGWQTRATLDQESFAQCTGTIYFLNIDTIELYSKDTWVHQHMQARSFPLSQQGRQLESAF